MEESDIFIKTTFHFLIVIMVYGIMADVNNSSSVIINGLLCFMQNSVSNVPKLSLVNVGSAFYTLDDIVAAKSYL